MDHIKSLEVLHRRAGRLIFNLPWDTPSDSVLQIAGWESIFHIYKLTLIKFFYNVISGTTPALLSSMVTYKSTKYHLRGNKILTPRFCSYYMKNSISYRGVVLWNTASRYYTDNFKQLYAKVRKDVFIKQLDFNATSIQTQSKNVTDFKFY